MDKEMIRCYQTQLVDVTYKTCYELFHGFDSIKAITFSYDIGFIDHKQNRKLFTIEKDIVTIELGNDKDSQHKCRSWSNSLPTELRAEIMITRDKSQITLDRTELEKLLGHTLKKRSFFS